MLINYNSERVYSETLDLVDPGNTTIKYTSFDGYTYFLVVKTVFGIMHFLEFGPVIPGEDIFLKDDKNNGSFTLKYYSKKWNEGKLASQISSFLNDPNKGRIASAEETVSEEALEDLIDIKAAFNSII